MSSIAYVSDKNMLEYHRLCRNRTILFWRPTTRGSFTRFKMGDLLFFYTTVFGKTKGFVGYGHYAGMKRLSLNQMWKTYGTLCGFDSFAQLENAIEKASKNGIPKTMQCLLLKEIVFFTRAVLPKEVGLSIPRTLESYTYIDTNTKNTTLEILDKAKAYGIDLWYKSEDENPEDIFYRDSVRVILSQVANLDEGYKTGFVPLEGFERISSNSNDVFRIEKDKIVVVLRLHFTANHKESALRYAMGKVYRYHRLALDKPIEVCYLDDAEIKELVKEINDKL